jgi:hypothetical protein
MCTLETNSKKKFENTMSYEEHPKNMSQSLHPLLLEYDGLDMVRKSEIQKYICKEMGKGWLETRVMGIQNWKSVHFGIH